MTRGKFIYCKTKSAYNLQKNNIPENAIVFIRDTKEIITHNTIFNSSTTSNFVGATTNKAGSAGLVPAPDQPNKYLKSNGTWVIPSISEFTNDSGYVTSSALNNYLPKSGGTLTADNSDTALILKGNSDGSWIAYRGSDSTFYGSIGVKSDNLPYFYHNDIGASKIWHESNFNPSDYLPLSGGTLNGYLSIKGNQTSAFNAGYLRLFVNAEEAGRIGLDSNKGLGLYAKGGIYIRPSNSFTNSTLGLVILSDSFTYNTNTVWHSGNFTPSSYLPLSGGTIKNTNRNLLTLEQNTTSTKDAGAYLTFKTGSYSTIIGLNVEVGTVIDTTGGNVGSSLHIRNDGTLKFRVGSQTNDTANVIWHSGNLTPSNYLPLSGGGAMTNNAYISMTAAANNTNLTSATPFGITYGRIQCYGSLNIVGDSDGSTNEYVNISSGYAEATTSNGLSIGYNSLKWKNSDILTLSNYGNHTHSYLPLAGGTMDTNASIIMKSNITSGSYIGSSSWKIFAYSTSLQFKYDTLNGTSFSTGGFTFSNIGDLGLDGSLHSAAVNTRELRCTTQGNGTYNIASISQQDSTLGLLLEGALASDSNSADKHPITFSWRGGFANKYGMLLMGTNTGSTYITILGGKSSLKLFSWDDGINYIESGNKDFTANVPLKITGIGGNNGSDLYLNFNNTRASGAVSASSGYVALTSHGTLLSLGAYSRTRVITTGWTASESDFTTIYIPGSSNSNDAYLKIRQWDLIYNGNTVLHSGNWSNFVTNTGSGGSNYLSVQDTRSSNSHGHSGKVSWHLKYNSSVGLNAANSSVYSGVLELSSWADRSAGRIYQMAFCGDNDDILFRAGQDSWGSWHRVYHTGNLTFVT